MDDGETFSHREGQIVWRKFVADRPDSKVKTLRISSRNLAQEKASEAVDSVALKNVNPSNKFAKSIKSVRVEKVIVMGLTNRPTGVKVEDGHELEFSYEAGVAADGKKEGTASILIIKDPGVAVMNDWAIVIGM